MSRQMAAIVEHSGNAPVILDDKGIAYISIHHDDLIRTSMKLFIFGLLISWATFLVLAVARKNVDPSMILVFLHSLVDVCILPFLPPTNCLS